MLTHGCHVMIRRNLRDNQKKKKETHGTCFFFFALCADFLRRSRRLHPHPHPQSDGMHGALQGLLLRGEGAAHHDGGLLPGRLPQQHPPQLLPGPAAGADLHQRGPGVLRQHLLQRGARCLDLCCFCLVLFSFFFFVCVDRVCFPPHDDATSNAQMEGE